MKKGIFVSQKVEHAKNLYLEGIRDGKAKEAVTKYTGARYTQHSTGVRDGIEGFVEFFESFIERNPKRDIQIIRTLEEGRHVFIHAHQSLNDGETEWVTTDFFDTDENDKIIEHWDVIGSFCASTPSGHTSVDGATEIKDLEKTQANKAIVKGLIEDVLMRKNPSNIETYISSETYIQHNKEVPDGLEAFKKLALGDYQSLMYQEIVLMVGQGNFVATLSKATWEDKPYAQVDLFRLEDGLVVEHWDNVEPVPPESEWVNSGKF